MFSRERRRTWLAFALLFACYQAAEGVGARLFGSFAVQGSLMMITVALAWPLGHWMGFRGWRAYALEWRPFNLAWLGGGLVMALLAKYVAACLGLAVGVYRPARIGFEETTSLQLAMALGTAVVFTFIPSFAEDILTRGFWYRAARIGWRGAWFVPFSALMFMLNHVYRLGDGLSHCLMLAASAWPMPWRCGAVARCGLRWGCTGDGTWPMPYSTACCRWKWWTRPPRPTFPPPCTWRWRRCCWPCQGCRQKCTNHASDVVTCVAEP